LIVTEDKGKKEARLHYTQTSFKNCTS